MGQIVISVDGWKLNARMNATLSEVMKEHYETVHSFTPIVWKPAGKSALLRNGGAGMRSVYSSGHIPAVGNNSIISSRRGTVCTEWVS